MDPEHLLDRVTTLLDVFTKDGLQEIARRFDIPTRNLRKAEIANRIGRRIVVANTTPPGLDHEFLAEFLSVLRVQDLRQFVYHVLETNDFGTTTTEFHALRKNDLVAFCTTLFTTYVCDNWEQSPLRTTWESCLVVYDHDDEDEDLDYDETTYDEASYDDAWDDYDSDVEEFEAQDVLPWQTHTTYEAGPGIPLPEGLTDRSTALLEHQREALDSLNRWWRAQNTSGILCMPTGSGKTRIAVEFALERLRDPSARVLWLAHRHELVNQAIAAFLQHGERAPRPFTIGRFEAGKRKTREQADVVVASLPTLAYRRDKKHPNVRRLRQLQKRFTLTVVDECHHAPAPSWRRLLKNITPSLTGRLLGLSATPVRSTERETDQLWKIFDQQPVYTARAVDLVRKRVLARPELVLVQTRLQFEATDKERELFQQFEFNDLPASLVNRIARSTDRNSQIVNAVVDRLRQSRAPSLVFAANIEHAETLGAMLRQRGLRVGVVHSRHDRDARRRTLHDMSEGRLDVLVNVALLTEGTDLPSVHNLFLARPTNSIVLFQQMVGRGMRGPRVGGTETCTIVGFEDNVANLLADQLVTTFVDKRTLESWLAGDTEDDDDTPSAKTTPAVTILDQDLQPTTELDPEAEPLLEWLQEAVKRGGVQLRDELRTARLKGWWELSADGRTWALPVFTPDTEPILDLIMNTLQSLQDDSALPLVSELRWVRASLAHAFVQAIRTTNTAPRFWPLDEATDEQLERLSRAAFAPDMTPPPSSGLVTPPGPSSSWLEHARMLMQSRDMSDMISLPFSGRYVMVSSADYERLREFWSQFGTVLSNANTEKEQLLRLCLGNELVRDIDRETTTTVLRAALEDGELPSPAVLEATPSLSALSRELATVPESERLEAARLLYEAYGRGEDAEDGHTFTDFLLQLATAGRQQTYHG